METLPPINALGDGGAETLAQYISDLAEEARIESQKWISLADENHVVYAYGDLVYDDEGKVIINDIQNGCISQVNAQTREDIAATLEPVETGEPGEFWWAGPPELAMQWSVPPENLGPSQDAMGGMQPAQPLATVVGDMARTAIASGVLPADSVVEINDKLVADTCQKVFDRFWKRAGINEFLREMILANAIQGFDFGYFEWDDDRNRPRLRLLSPKQVYMDPTAWRLADAQWAGVDQVIDAREAMSLYPHLSAQIAESASTGKPVRIDGHEYGRSADRDYKREVVTMRIFWLRDQPVAEVQDDTAGEVPSGIGQENLGDEPGSTSGIGSYSDGGSPGDPGRNGDMGSPADDSEQPILGSGSRFGLFEEPEPVQPPEPQIVAYAIRQITQINEMIVDDRVCEHWDIPLLHNRNIPVPKTQFGQGEPYRLRKMQEARNRGVTNMVAHTDYYNKPIGIIPQSVYDEMDENERENLHIKPGLVLVVQDEILRTNPNAITIIDPPAMPEALVTTVQMLKNEIGDSSGHTPEMRGVGPADQSGKAIELKQAAATSVIAFKSQGTADVVERLSKLLLHCLVYRLPVEEWAKVVSKYPIHVLQAIISRAQRFEWDVNVVVSSGSGAVLAQKKQERVQQLQLGLVSKQTTQEELGIDPQKEQERQQKEMAGMMGGAPGALPLNQSPGNQTPPGTMQPRMAVA